MARNDTIHVAVRRDVKERLQRLADTYGLTMSALAAYVIGQWVYQQEKVIEPLLQDIKAVAVRAVSEAEKLER